uniref:Sulfotransferase n=1 Tax=Bubo bubo TaxID=30461 RepID=A0A8C0FDA5_BUBBB
MNTHWHSSQTPAGSCLFRSSLPAAVTQESDLPQGTSETLLPQTFALWDSSVLYKHGVICCLFHDISQHFAGLLEAKVFSKSTHYEVFLDAWSTEMQQFITMERIPWLEYRTENRDYAALPLPRVFATHLPYYLLPRDLRNKRGRIIYVTRNPKDVMVSYYHFSKYISTLEEIPDFNLFMERFLAGKVLASSWLDHVAGWYSHAEDFNILFVTYEEMKKHREPHLAGQQQGNAEEVRNCFPRLALCSGLWRDARSASHFPLLPLSSGIVGDWKNIMTVAQNERFDKVLTEKMKTLDLYVAFSGVAH